MEIKTLPPEQKALLNNGKYRLYISLTLGIYVDIEYTAIPTVVDREPDMEVHPVNYTIHSVNNFTTEWDRKSVPRWIRKYEETNRPDCRELGYTMSDYLEMTEDPGFN